MDIKGLGQLNARGDQRGFGSEWDIITVLIHFCFKNTQKNDDYTKTTCPKISAYKVFLIIIVTPT